MSAPPIAAVVVYPFKKLRTVLADNAIAAIIGDPGAMVTKAPIVAMLAPKREEFTTCRPRKASGREDIRPASLRKATIEPVKVIPPIMTPKYAVTRWSVEIWETSAMTLAMLVKTAARPTTECRAATVWGKLVAVMRRPMTRPARAPIPATAAN